jgi:hypothetical protein
VVGSRNRTELQDYHSQPSTDCLLGFSQPAGWGCTTLSMEAAPPMARLEITLPTRLLRATLSSTARSMQQAATAFKLQVKAFVSAQCQFSKNRMRAAVNLPMIGYVMLLTTNNRIGGAVNSPIIGYVVLSIAQSCDPPD